MPASAVLGWYRRPVRSALLTAALMLAVTGCGEAMTGAGSESTLITETPTEAPEIDPTATETPTSLPTATDTPAPLATATMAATSSLPATTTEARPESQSSGPQGEIAPPLAVLTAASGAQEAGLGTYCWEQGNQGLCADFAGLPVPDPPLVVEQGERLTIAVPGIDQLVNVYVDVYDHAAAKLDGDTLMIHYPTPDSIDLPYVDNGGSVTVTADLPPGRYVISLFVGFPAEPFPTITPGAVATTVRGDAVYGFSIEISDTSR